MKKNICLAALAIVSVAVATLLVELIHNPGAYLATLTHPVGHFRKATNALEIERIRARNDLWKQRFDLDRIEQAYQRPDEGWLFKEGAERDEAFKREQELLESAPANDPLDIRYRLMDIIQLKPTL